MPKLKQTSTKNLSEIDWQKLRQSFSSRGMVGGSDAGTLLGWNKWKSPINLFYQSIGMDLLPTKMNRQMAFGKMLEDTIAEMWQYWDGEENFIQNVIHKNKVRKFKKVCYSPT
jgi:predicted phage-related endonuclease